MKEKVCKVPETVKDKYLQREREETQSRIIYVKELVAKQNCPLLKLPKRSQFKMVKDSKIKKKKMRKRPQTKRCRKVIIYVKELVAKQNCPLLKLPKRSQFKMVKDSKINKKNA